MLILNMLMLKSQFVLAEEGIYPRCSQGHGHGPYLGADLEKKKFQRARLARKLTEPLDRADKKKIKGAIGSVQN